MINAESWKRLTRAAAYYEGKGFKYKDVPWLITPETSAITRPAWSEDFYVNEKVLVGSAEQSFLELYDSLDNGLYYAITPCFRNEPEVNDYHRTAFMKLELFSKNLSRLEYLRHCAQIFFYEEFPYSEPGTIKIIELGDNDWDLNYLDYELGSYNTKEHEGKAWACGTGLAEPRFSQALRARLYAKT